MAGIYIHIPFCKQACNYCDFHFSTSLKTKPLLVSAIKNELQLQHNYLGNEPVETIYFGGGTPSLLTERELKDILKTISENYSISKNPEITLEANPDDLTIEKLKELKNTGINRLSIGTQSFFDGDLVFIKRAHNANEALNSIKNAQEVGVENISIDLIYGLPSTNKNYWRENLQKAVDMNVQHLSCYALTVEEKTLLHQQVKSKAIHLPVEKVIEEEFLFMVDFLGQNNFEHYEISNFSKPGLKSKHNTSYWLGKKYLGIGPSAHSFDSESRQWNISNNHQYIKALAGNRVPFEKEERSVEDKHNEYVLTMLRTKWGIDLEYIKRNHSLDLVKTHSELISGYQKKALIKFVDERLVLTNAGKLFADKIASDLFI